MFLCGTGRRCARWVRVRDADSETGTTGEEGGGCMEEGEGEATAVARTAF